MEVNCILASQLSNWSSSPQMGGKMSSRTTGGRAPAPLVTAGGGVKGFSAMAGGSMIAGGGIMAFSVMAGKV